VTIVRLAVRNFGRDKLRAALTVVGVAVAIVAFSLLHTVGAAWVAGPEAAPRDRVVTRHKVTFAMALPRHYVERVRSLPHVRSATWASWFAGKDPQHDTEFFGTVAVDAGSYFAVYDDMQVPRDQLDAFEHDKQGAIVGDVLARRLGWKLGDRVTLRSGIVPGEWPFRIDGVYSATSKVVDRSSFIMRWDYVNDVVPTDRRDMVGWIVSRVDDPEHAADAGLAIDRMFDDRDTQTLSQDERAFNASFLAMLSAVLDALDTISGVIMVIVALILGNTVAMGVRERTGEYGVLRAIGFSPRHVALWVLGESLVMGATGGLLGVVAAYPFINFLVARFVEENMGAFFPSFRLEARQMAVDVVLSCALGAAAAAFPAWRASRTRVIEAIRRVA
jgi:putative ABC transport system permease protein